MGYNFLNIEINDWESFINQYTEVSVFGTEAFLKATASVYNYNLDIKVVSFNNKPILAVPLFTQGNKVVSPNHYYYQFMWEKETSKESWTQIEAWDFLLKELKKKYKQIKLRLPPSIQDVRPFMWNNFNVTIRYTYEKDLKELKYNENINRIISKKQNDYTFKKNCDWDTNWSFHKIDLLNFGIRNKSVNLFLKYFEILASKNLIQVFNTYYKNKFLTSIVTIIDNKHKIAYFPLIGTSKVHSKNGLSTLLYHFAISQLRNDNIKIVDFCGANLKSISKYKNKFLPQLTTYYEVSYFRNIAFLNFIQKFIKDFLKKYT